MRTWCAQSMKCFVVKRGEKKDDNYKTDIRESNSSFALIVYKYKTTVFAIFVFYNG